MVTLGIDIGSAATKAVILEDGTRVAGEAKVNMGTGTSGIQKTLDLLLEEHGLSMEDFDYIVATGYGRKWFKQADREMSELSCHARGVAHCVPDARTVIDIGGQDAKTIRLGKNGRMSNFVMNDKCAAGTGRFLEVMANILETSVDRMGALDELATQELQISATCTVFAESEVISQLSRGKCREDIVRAIHESVAKRVASMAKRAGIEDKVVMTGGVAQNPGIVRALSRELNRDVQVPEEPQMMGALGAALFAYEEAVSGKKAE